MFNNAYTVVNYPGKELTFYREHKAISLRSDGCTFYDHNYNFMVGVKSGSSRTIRSTPPNKQNCRSVKDLCKVEDSVEKLPNDVTAWETGAYVYLRYFGLDSAKGFLHRGIVTMDSSPPESKMTLWKHLLILDARYGTKEDVLATLEQAFKRYNKKEFSIKMLLFWMSDEYQMELIMIRNIILEKFQSEKELYIILYEHYLKKGARGQAKLLAERSVVYVPLEEHSDMLERFSALERQYGWRKPQLVKCTKS